MKLLTAFVASALSVCALYGQAPAKDSLPSIPEAKGYELVYDLDLSKLGKTIKYDIDKSADFKGSFDRVGYLLELGKKDAPEYVFVSIPAFTDDLAKIGIPSLDSKAEFQTMFEGMDVASNVKDIVCGKGLKGNMEFWPNNYSQGNAKKIPDASDKTFDFGDAIAKPVDGYGCMQVHNYDAKQTVFAINHWVNGSKADIGIGNSPKNNPDWTFTNSAPSYELKRLRVFVHPKW